jgi:hypothetical protein
VGKLRLGTALAVTLAACGRIGFQSGSDGSGVGCGDGPGGGGSDGAPADAPISIVIASDDFARTVANGWGNADVGGAWSVFNPNNCTVSVGSGHGIVAMSTTTAHFDSHVYNATALDAETSAIVSFDRVPTTASYSTDVNLRWVANGTDYRLHLAVQAGGSADVYILRGSGGVLVQLGSATPIAAVTPNVGVALSLRATGASPTTLCGKAWPASSAEPSACMVSASDSAAYLQVPGLSYLDVDDVGDTPPTVSFSTFRYLQVGPM